MPSCYLLLVTTEANPLIRKDNRCGSAYLLSDGSPAQCDPYGDLFCCSKWGFCGFTSEHCECSDCIDYRKNYSINTTEGEKLPQYIFNNIRNTTLFYKVLLFFCF